MPYQQIQSKEYVCTHLCVFIYVSVFIKQFVLILPIPNISVFILALQVFLPFKNSLNIY